MHANVGKNGKTYAMPKITKKQLLGLHLGGGT